MPIIVTETFFSTPPSSWSSPGRCRLFWPCCISLHAGEKSGPYHAGVQGAYDRLSGGHCDSELWYRAREYCIRVPSEGVDLPFYHNLQGRIGFNTINHPLSTEKDFPIHSLGQHWWWIEWPYPTKTRELLGDPHTSLVLWSVSRNIIPRDEIFQSTLTRGSVRTQYQLNRTYISQVEIDFSPPSANKTLKNPLLSCCIGTGPWLQWERGNAVDRRYFFAILYNVAIG